MLLIILDQDGSEHVIKGKLKTICRRKMHMPIECSWDCQDCLVKKYQIREMHIWDWHDIVHNRK